MAIRKIEELENIIYVYDKDGQLLAIFDDSQISSGEESMRSQMVAPRIKISQNGESTLSFQMLANSTKWNQIKEPTNIYYVNGRYYTPMTEGAYQYTGEGSIRVVNVICVEIFYLLSKQYNQCYNCGLYTYAKADFQSYTNDGAIFKIESNGCSNPGNTITAANAWSQVKQWRPKDDSGNELSYSILKGKDYAPNNWDNAPSAVALKSFNVSGNTATIEIKARATQEIQQNFDFDMVNIYQLEKKPYPANLKNVYVNSTIVTRTENTKRYTTSNKEVKFSYNSRNGTFSINYSIGIEETMNYVIAIYDYSDIGEIKNNASCTFAFGAEVVDEHTFIILPKADKRYKLTIDGIEYEDSQVKDQRGVVMPRGSGGYAMWAALKNSGWTLGICDVIAKDFDASIDYGCFNIESDQKDILYNIQYIQQLYGGILDWDSKQKILNYRAENNEYYQSYNDGFNEWTGYEFREGKNMKDQPEVIYDNDIITRAYLLGYNGLNVKKVNDGKTYIDNFSYTKDIYEGYLEQPLIYDTNDDGGQKQLLYWGKKELSKKCRPRKTIKINANDIRTVEGYSHEIFDIHQIVRVYSKESDTDVETYEEKRIISWEYNAFALWDSTVELGDKTQNFSELFKLIYNKSVIDAPKTNASGKISADEIVMEVDVSDYTYDLIDMGEYDIGGISPGGAGEDSYGIGGYGYGSTLSQYISLIARKTTQNSEAVAGLTIQATDLFAQTELFTTYQKQTEDMISETYAGLKLYADEKGSELSATVEGNYKTLTQQIDGTNRTVQQLEVSTRAGFEAQENINYSYSRQLAEHNSTLRDLDREITDVVQSQASFEAYADRTYATTRQVSSLESDLYNAERDIRTVTSSLAQFETYANRTYATTSQLSQYATQTYVDGQLRTKTSLAEVKTYADAHYASASMEATIDNISSVVKTDTQGSYLQSKSGSSKGYIKIYSTGNAQLYASGNLVIKANTLDLMSRRCVWKSQKVMTGATSSTTIYYLGY